MDNRGMKDQVISGLWLAAKTLLVIFTGYALVGGVVLLRRPDPDPRSILARHSLVPWICLAIATGILIPTTYRWVTILPGILGYGALGGLIMLTIGHYGNMHVPRLIALALTLFMILSSVLTSSFSRRNLSLIDRFALLAFLFCLAFGFTPDIFAMTVALGIGLSTLLCAWVLDRIRRRDGQKSSRHQPHSPPPDGSSGR